MTYFIPNPILANLRKSLALGVQILMLVARQSTTQVKMVEIETNPNEGYSNRTPKQALKMPQISQFRKKTLLKNLIICGLGYKLNFN